MTSPKQIKANQQNSTKSTGPKTEEGKYSISKNALKHGLLSKETILPWENIADLQALSTSLIDSLKPFGEMELILVDRIVSLIWRLKRAGKIETAIFAWHRYSDALDSAYSEAKAYQQKHVPGLEEFFAPKISKEDEIRYDKAMRKVSENSVKANSELPTLGRHYIEQADLFSKLNRYETSLEKSLFKSLHELQRIQASRLGISSQPPIAVDVYGDGK